MIIVLDTETTGLNPADGDEVIELAAKQLGPHHPILSALIRPAKPIPPEASAVHHLTDETFFDMGWDTLASAWDNVIGVIASGEQSIVYAAHNAAFDREFLKQFTGEVPWLCTWRCALHLFPDAPGHSNQVLRYYLKRKPAIPAYAYPHRANYDVAVTADLLSYMLELKSLEELLKLQDNPVLLTKVNFGRYRGARWDVVPYDYLSWVSKQDFDKDVMYTVLHYMRKK